MLFKAWLVTRYLISWVSGSFDHLLVDNTFLLFSTESEDPAQLILLFEKSIALSDRDSNILANYALVQVTLGERDAAEGLLNRALKEGISTPPVASPK